MNVRGRFFAFARPVVAACVVLALGETAHAQNVTAAALKAAFLYNFAKFAEWPATALAPRQRLSLCVTGDNDLAGALEQTIKGYAIEDHELVVTILEPEAPATGCHLLYISGQHLKRATGVLANVRNLPVLTVSDGETFAASGGIAQLIVQRNQVRFAVNSAAAGRARIRLSSKLLRLSHPIEENANATR